MAKIYETQEDFEKDKLHEQAMKTRLSARSQSSTGLGLVGLSFIADLYRERKPETRGWLGYVSSILSIGGIIQIVRSWFTDSTANSLELERERLGPETIILPPAAEEPNHKHYSRAIEPKTLMEQADKSCDCPLMRK